MNAFDSDSDLHPIALAQDRLLGVAVHAVTPNMALDWLCAQAMTTDADGPPHYTVAINPEKVMRARREPALRPVLEGAGLQIPDGIGIVLASRLRGGPIQKRVTGIDLAMNFCQEAATRGWPVFLLGAAPGVAEAAGAELLRRYPNLHIAGTGDGYFRGKDHDVARRVRDSGARILFLALGSPAQEYWMQAYLAETGCRVGLGVGGTFDVLAGRMERAPRSMRKLGLEWFYRLIREPSRYRRMAVLPIFLVRALVERRGPLPPGQARTPKHTRP